MREISYGEAIREAFAQMLASDPRVFTIGQGVWSPWYVGASMADLDREFGRERVIDTPVSENGMTGIAIGAALAGMRPIVVHPRMDFMLLAIDQIVNEAANWHFMCGGRLNVPIVIRPIINRGGEQAAQHSQALQAMLAHIPGLKVVMPATPYDAKGLLVASVQDENPVVYIDDRWLYSHQGEVPEELYAMPIGKGLVRREGSDVTIAAISCMVPESLEAAVTLQDKGIEVEVIDMRSVKPLDYALVIQSVSKTGRLVVADTGWTTCGVAAEIAAKVASDAFSHLKAPILRVALPDAPAPMSSVLEKAYYVGADDVVKAVERVVTWE